MLTEIDRIDNELEYTQGVIVWLEEMIDRMEEDEE